MKEAAIDLYGSEAQPGINAGLQEAHSWGEDTRKQIQDFSIIVGEVGTAREALTAKLTAGKTALIDSGFNKDALDAAIKYAKTPEDKRENWDLTYLYCRKALGAPIQDDLFAAANQERVNLTRTIPADE